jgi:hypothetical protein
MGEEVSGCWVASSGLPGDVIDQSDDILGGGWAAGEPSSRGIGRRELDRCGDGLRSIRATEPIDDGR